MQQFLQSGGKHVDTAFLYDNHREIRQALLEARKSRDDIFLTSKLYPCRHFGYEKAYQAASRILATEMRGFHFFDVLLLHHPGGEEYCREDEGADAGVVQHCATIGWRRCRFQTWLALDLLHRESRLRFGGVSNFNVEVLQELLADLSEHEERGGDESWADAAPGGQHIVTSTTLLRPSVHQLEVHPWWHPQQTIRFSKQHGMQIVAYGSLGKGTLALTDNQLAPPPGFTTETMIEIFHSTNLKPGEVLLRWGLAKGCAVIPRSSNAERMRENVAAGEKRDWGDGEGLRYLPRMVEELLDGFYKENTAAAMYDSHLYGIK